MPTPAAGPFTAVGQFFSQQRKLFRPRIADKARQKPGRAAIRHKADAAEGLKEISGLGAKNEIAHQRETHADTGSRSVHCRQERHFQIAQAAQEGVIGGFETRARIRRAAFIVAAPLQVGARAEAAPFARHDQAAQAVGRVLDRVHGVHQPFEHFIGNCVHDFRMVEHENTRRALDIEPYPVEIHLSLPVSVAFIRMGLAGSLSLKVRFALLQKGGDAFSKVRVVAQHALRIALIIELCA